MKSNFDQKEAAREIVQRLQIAGHEAFWAGGCVRDRLLGRAPKDYDVATSARPDEVENLFEKTIPIGKAFGVIAVIVGNTPVEVATFRAEDDCKDGRHPGSVRFCAAREDALRRDFTINGMFFDPIRNELRDYVCGAVDIKQQCVRTIGQPAERFREDYLRMLRAVRFAHTLGFVLTDDTKAAIRAEAASILRISAERVEAEFTRTLTESRKPGVALLQLHALGLLEHFLPEVVAMIGVENPPGCHPEEDVFTHTVLMLNHMANSQIPSACTPRELAFSVLLHDIAKPYSADVQTDENARPRICFPGHEKRGAKMADEVLKRLRLPTRERQRIVQVIAGHTRHAYAHEMRRSALRKLMGEETFDCGLELYRLDCLASGGVLDSYEFLCTCRSEFADAPVLPERWITGRDLVEAGIPESASLGRMLDEAYEQQLEGRYQNREALWNWLRETYRPIQ